MSNYRFLAAMLCALSATACGTFQKSAEMSAADTMLNSAWHANLVSPMNSGRAVTMSGSASMVPSSDDTQTVINVSLANASPGGLHSWEARKGRCGVARSDDGVLGASDAYEGLTIDANGRASGMSTVEVPIPSDGGYSVVVYTPEAGSRVVEACGNLVAPTR